MSSPSLTAYFILGLLLIGAFAALVVGMRRHRLRIAQGLVEQPAAEESALLFGRSFNANTFVHRALLTERLWKRPAAGLAHTLLLGGAVVAILGHALFALSFVGVEVYSGWIGTVLMRWGRELAGLAMLLGVVFFLVRRLSGLERLIKGGERKGFLAMEVLLLVTVIAGFVAEGFRLATLPDSSSGEFIGNMLAAGLGGLGAEADHIEPPVGLHLGDHAGDLGGADVQADDQFVVLLAHFLPFRAAGATGCCSTEASAGVSANPLA